MDPGTSSEAGVSVDDVATTWSELGSNTVESVAGVSSNGELASAGELLTRLELDLACTSEKLYNLNILTMHVGSKESEFELSDLEKDEIMGESIEKALEFDFLSVFVDSEVTELEYVISSFHKEIADVSNFMSSHERGSSYLELEEKLADIEKPLEQLREQLNELKAQSAMFQKTASCFAKGEKGARENGEGFSTNGESLNVDAKIKTPTAEQQKHFLRMLEKSLARELDLDKKVSESKQIEEDLKLKLRSAEEVAFCLEEEMLDILKQFFEADNSAEVFLSISKELLGRTQISQFNINALTQREAQLRSQLENSENGSQHQLDALHEDVTEKDNIILKLKEKLSAAESTAVSANERCKVLLEANSKLDEELGLLKRGGLTLEKVESLEKQLKESDILLQQAVASAEASEEKQNMLYLSIKDMEKIIEDLKLKVSKAENRADSAEDKCIILSASNAELTEELSFLRGKLDCLEGSLHQAEEAKLATAVDITVRTKLIANLVMQLAVERERLHNQVSSLSKQNKGLVIKLQQTNKGSAVLETTQDSPGSVLSSGHVFRSATLGTESKEGVIKEATTLEEVDENMKDGVAQTDVELPVSSAQLQPVRRIDAGILSFKHVSVAVMFLFIGAALYLFPARKIPFLI